MSTLDGIPGMSKNMKAFVQNVRTFLRDHPELNRLIAGEETNSRMLAWSAVDALADFNGTPPITTYDFDFLLEKQQHHLLTRMTAETVVESVTMLQMRNHINYSTGGLNVGVSDKTPLLMNWLQFSKSVTQQKLQRVKVALNIESILGADQVGVHSEYWNINSTYLSW